MQKLDHFIFVANINLVLCMVLLTASVRRAQNKETIFVLDGDLFFP